MSDSTTSPIEELDELIADMRAIGKSSDLAECKTIAAAAAELLAAVRAILPPGLHKRRCHSCGRVGYHAARNVPLVCCGQCGSADTRPIRRRVAAKISRDRVAAYGEE